MKEYYKEYAYTKMPWGKHKGIFLKDIPDNYLKWAIITWRDRGMTEMIRIELLRRVPSIRRLAKLQSSNKHK